MKKIILGLSLLVVASIQVVANEVPFEKDKNYDYLVVLSDNKCIPLTSDKRMLNGMKEFMYNPEKYDTKLGKTPQGTNIVTVVLQGNNVNFLFGSTMKECEMILNRIVSGKGLFN